MALTRYQFIFVNLVFVRKFVESFWLFFCTGRLRFISVKGSKIYLVGFSLSFAELLDILLDLLHDFRVKGWSVAEKEENLHEDE